MQDGSDAAGLEEVRRRLAGLCIRPQPWNDVQELLPRQAGILPFLGGDGLRPYATWADGERVTIVDARRASDSREAPLVRSIASGEYGLAVKSTSHVDQALVTTTTVSRSQRLDRRLVVQNVLLVGLADISRYTAARLPLGIARLAQWLRFTHSARVDIVDYASEVDAPLELIRRKLLTSKFDIVGIGVNFGHWKLLEEIADSLNGLVDSRIVLGNILPAHSPDAALRLFDSWKNEVLIAPSLGEIPLETLCRELADPVGPRSNHGLITRDDLRKRRVSAKANTAVGPPEVVLPDEGMIHKVVEKQGQVSMETSFGCQFGKCTFCPRDHRGNGWRAGDSAEIMGILDRLSGSRTMVSFVDEEFFGSDGLSDPPQVPLLAETVLERCRDLDIRCEIYTRIEQIADRRRSDEWNARRASVLRAARPILRRVFLGVESGVTRQLRRYGKGQSLGQIVDSLGVASALDLPMEFGFITFDPLLSVEELVDNLRFLGRRDILRVPIDCQPSEAGVVAQSVLESNEIPLSNTPLYERVSYMATELEVLSHSRYATRLRRVAPDLIAEASDPNFARLKVTYRDPAVGNVAGWCRVWTEGMFSRMYKRRMAARSDVTQALHSDSMAEVVRYRRATYWLMVALVRAHQENHAVIAVPIFTGLDMSLGDDVVATLSALESWVTREPSTGRFDPGHLTRSRAS